MYWEVPKDWTSATCFVLGGGPSLSAVDLEQVRASAGFTIAVNNTYQLAPWAEYLYFMDEVWYGWHEEALSSFPGEIVTSVDNLSPHPRIKVLRRGKRFNLDPRPTHMSHGNNSGHGGVCLGAMLGASRIILFGFDMCTVGGRHNYHDDHQRTVPENIYLNQYVKSFVPLSEDLERLGVEVINSTPNSLLDVFPTMTPEEALTCLR